MKYDGGKPKLSLIYSSFLTDVAKVREYGVKKYGADDGWKSTDAIKHYDACLRHMFQAMEAYKNNSIEEMLDAESGVSHLAHAACNIMFLIEEMYVNKMVKGFEFSAINLKEVDDGSK